MSQINLYSTFEAPNPVNLYSTYEGPNPINLYSTFEAPNPYPAYQAGSCTTIQVPIMQNIPSQVDLYSTFVVRPQVPVQAGPPQVNLNAAEGQARETLPPVVQQDPDWVSVSHDDDWEMV